MKRINKRTKVALMVGYLLVASILAMGATVSAYGDRPIGVELVK